MDFHPIAYLFPKMPEEDFQAFKADIKKHGQQLPVLTYEGKIIDGRHRYRACKELGLKLKTKEVDYSNEWFAVQSMNLRRRHLSASQISAIYEAAKDRWPQLMKEVKKLKSEAKKRQETGRTQKGGRPRKGTQKLVSKKTDKKRNRARNQNSVLGQEARKIGVSLETLGKVQRVRRKDPEEFKHVLAGTKSAGRALRDIRRRERKEQIAKAKPVKGRYRVFYADPPWKYGDSREGIEDKYSGAERHYQTKSVVELCEEFGKQVKGACEDDAVLFLWATSPLLEDAFEVINAWGFNYKASIVWDKDEHNFGHYVSVRHELLLIATKGSCLPDVNKLHPSVVRIKREKHSKKPAKFRKLIDAMYPHGNRAELFARTKAEGWDSFGAEITEKGKL